MYCNAITTRLLVGRLTPAIRATWFAPVAGGAGRFSAPDRGDNAKCRDDTRPSARAGIGVVLMQNGCRVLKDSNSFRQPLLTTELTPPALRLADVFGALAASFRAAGFFVPLPRTPALLKRRDAGPERFAEPAWPS